MIAIVDLKKTQKNDKKNRVLQKNETPQFFTKNR